MTIATPEAESTVPSPSSSKSPSDKPFNVVRALTLRQKGLTYDQIAELMDEPKSTVYFKLIQLSQALENPKHLQDYRDHRTNLLDIAEERMLRSVLDEEAIGKASLNNRAYAFQQIFNARRLESGKSTENLGVLGKLVVEAAGEVFRKPSTLPVDNKTE